MNPAVRAEPPPRAVLLLALLFLTTGALHFLRPEFFMRIVPPWIGDPSAAVFWSGVAEVLGGAGLLVPRLRRAAAVGLILLLVLVFPANVHMLRQALRHDRHPLWIAALWLRLPLQPLLIWFVWRVRART